MSFTRGFSFAGRHATLHPARTIAASFALGATGGALLINSVPKIKAETEKKSIYDDDKVPDPKSEPPTVIRKPPAVLESYVRSARESLSRGTHFISVHLDVAMERYLAAESTVTTTVSELKSENEALFPGAIYVLVATLTGSIVARKRNVVLRGLLVPSAFGVAAFAYFLPTTYTNVGNLIWKFELIAPAVANAHVKTKNAITDFVETVHKFRTDSRAKVEDAVRKTRQALKKNTGLLITEEDEKKK
ncbi:apolipo protein O-domain-containing protein [Lipomyces kononenkoae]|uniref:Apolipo protein O-domain-containing protein n=1 Tax=Lipomyces kononenkoae TaxID=34357 RepID=A0ACC3SQN0_LIPKO